ncbi:MAG: GAF domain-containing protein, partial [Anaerolineales bacterium]
DMQQFYRSLHQIIAGLMYAENLFIAGYEASTGMLSFPYFVDASGDEAPSPTPLSEFHGGTSYVIRTGTLHHASRERSAEMYRAGLVEPTGTQSEDWVGVPLKADGETVGVLVVQSYEPGVGYNDQDVGVLAFISQHIATALTRVRALEETRQRNAELAIINSVQQGLASKLEMQAIYDLVGDKIREVFPEAQEIGILTYDPAEDLIHPRYVVERGLRYEIPAWKPVGFRQHVIESRQTMVINRDVPRLAAEYENPLIVGEWGKSYAFVPMLLAGQVTGIIELAHMDREDAFSDADVRLLQTLSNAMSVALENARLFDEVQTRNREISEALEQQTATSDILRVIAQSPTDVQPVLEVITEHAAQLCDGVFAAVYRTDGKQVFEIATRNFTPQGVEVHLSEYPRPLAMDSSLSSRAILGGRPIHIADFDAAPDLPDMTRRYGVALGMRSLIMVPMMKDGSAIGAIAVGRRAAGLFSAKQRELLKTFADQAVIAIENVRLFKETSRLLKETEQRAAELAIINSVQAGLASKLDMQAIYDLVGDEIRAIFHNVDLGIRIYEPETDLVHFPYVHEKGERVRVPAIPRAGFAAHVLQTREPLLINDRMAEKAAEFGVSVIPGTSMPKASLYVPLMVGHEARGLIDLETYEREHAFSESDVRLLTTVANAMTGALENARLFAEVEERNREISEALEQQTATSEILRVIASSPGDIQPVLDAVARNAARLCESYDAAIARVDGNVYKVVSQYGPVPMPEKNVRQGVPIDRDTVTGAAILESRTIQVDDVLAEPEGKYSRSKEFSGISQQRTMLATP